MIRRQLINFQNRSVDVRVGLGAFDELSRMFSSAVGKPKRAMVVWNDATSERFGEVVEHALVDAGFAVSPLVLEVSPAGATLADADTVFGTCSIHGIHQCKSIHFLAVKCNRNALFKGKFNIFIIIFSSPHTRF